jgi:hypothetical protein
MEQKEKKLTRKALLAILVGALAIVTVIIAVIIANSHKLTAIVMRLIRQEGEVTLLDASGQDAVIMDNMKLYSGNALETGEDGLVDLSLDDTKYLTIENKSNVVFEKSGKALELKLNSGRLFFNVTEKLADDETMDISTSTMVVGIRGTSGWVDAENSDLYIGDGTLHVKGINPKTGEIIEADFTAGQKVHVYLLDKDGKTVAFELENYTIEDVPREMLRNIVQYPELFERFVEETGFEPKEVIREAIIKEILEEDMELPEEYEELLKEVIEEMEEIEEEEEPEEEEPEEEDEEEETPPPTETEEPEAEQEEEPPAQQDTTPTQQTTTTPTTYTITVNAAEGGSGSASATSAEAGTAITLTATPDAAYAFSGWSVVEGGITITDNGFTMPAANVTVAPTFTRRTSFTLSASCPSGYGSLFAEIGEADVSYSEDRSSLTATVAPNEEVFLGIEETNERYRFDGWTASGGVTLNQDNGFSMPESDVTVTANFRRSEINFITINYDPTYLSVTKQYGNDGSEEPVGSGEAITLGPDSRVNLIVTGNTVENVPYMLDTATANSDECELNVYPGTDSGTSTCSIYTAIKDEGEDYTVTLGYKEQP